MVTLSPALRRILAVAILAAPLAALWGLVVGPVTTKFESYDQSIAQSQALLARYLRIGAARERLQRQLKEVRQTQASLGGFLEGASGELAAAQLQNKVKGLVEASAGRLKSIQMLKEQEENNFRRVAIRVTMIADTEAVQKTFYALESTSPYLFLDNIDIRASRRVRASRRRARKTQSAGDLQVRYDVYGYMRVEKP